MSRVAKPPRTHQPATLKLKATTKEHVSCQSSGWVGVNTLGICLTVRKFVDKVHLERSPIS